MTVFSVLGLTQVGYFILNFPWPIFIVFFCHLLVPAYFLKKSQNCIVTNFCSINNLFHHKYIDESFNKGVTKNKFLCETNIGCKSPRHFRRWGGLCAHTRKKSYPHSIIAAGGALVPTQEKKSSLSF